MAREIQDNIKMFIKDQLPGFYQSEGPMFATFLDAYYEYLEQSGQTLDYSRDLIPRVVDIDNTTSEFLEHFKAVYLNGFPGSFKAGTELTIKNVLDFYKAKGTPRAVELLFQILYVTEYFIINFVFIKERSYFFILFNDCNRSSFCRIIYRENIKINRCCVINGIIRN